MSRDAEKRDGHVSRRSHKSHYKSHTSGIEKKQKKFGRIHRLRRAVSSRSLNLMRSGSTLRENLTPWVKTIWVKLRLNQNRNLTEQKEYLERVYAHQAQAYDQMRSRFLWGRQPRFGVARVFVSARQLSVSLSLVFP